MAGAAIIKFEPENAWEAALTSHVPAFNAFFGTAPLAPWQLALSLPFALAIPLGDEIRRIFVRAGNRFVLKWLTW